LKRSSKIIIISGIVAIVIIAAALTVHFRLSESERSEIESGTEQNEKESASDVVNEITNSLLNKPKSEENESGEQGENESGEQAGTTEQNENAEQTNTAQNITSQIDISVKEVDEAYRWSNSNEINPTITLTANIDNVIQFTNPTDTKHAFIIGLNDKVILESKDIGPGASGKLSIKPTENGVFEYHCKYHPDTMKGILNVEP
jgi:plastocyanin